MVTIKDIAKRTGVSYTTVSRALNGKPGVNQSTMELVLSQAKKMGYQPNGIARGLVKKYTNTIGLIIPDITNPYFPAMARGVEDEANKQGYNVFLCNTNWDKAKEQTYLSTLLEKRVDGIIFHPSEEHQIEENIRVPMVLLNTKMLKDNKWYIAVDNEKGGFMATKHLIECGYRTIAFIGGSPKSYTNEERLTGYKRALQQYNLNIDKSLITFGDFTTKNGYELMEGILKSKLAVDAVFAANDLVALGVMKCVNDYGLKIPKDIGVVGFDNIQLADLPQVQLTTISQPIYHMGKIAFQQLFSQIKEKEISVSEETILEPELIIRNTTCVKVK